MQLRDPRLGPIVERYSADMLTLADALRHGRITMITYRAQQAQLAASTTQAVILLAGASVNEPLMADFWRQQQRQIVTSSWKLSRDLANGRYSDTDDDPGALERLIKRLRLWISSLLRAWHYAILIPGRAEDLLQWFLGATEAHCTTCLSHHERIAPRAYWRELARQGIYPQGPGLECGGWYCDCEIVPVRPPLRQRRQLPPAGERPQTETVL